MEQSPQNVGTRLRAMRLKKKLTQDQLEAMSGIPRSTIVKIELNGETITPRPQTIKALAKHVGATYEYLMYGVVSVDKFHNEVRAMAIHVNQLSPDKRQKILEIINLTLKL